MSNSIPLDQVGRVQRFLYNKTHDPNSKPVRRDAIGCLLGLCGLRITEIKNLTVQDWRRHRPRLRVRTLKGGPERSLPIPESLAQILDRWTWRRKYAEPLLATSKGRAFNDRNLRRRWEQWSIEILGAETHYRFHDLRHTAAHVVFNNATDGLGIFAVKHVLRHSKLENSLLYLISEKDIQQWMTPTTSTRQSSQS